MIASAAYATSLRTEPDSTRQSMLRQCKQIIQDLHEEIASLNEEKALNHQRIDGLEQQLNEFAFIIQETAAENASIIEEASKGKQQIKELEAKCQQSEEAASSLRESEKSLNQQLEELKTKVSKANSELEKKDRETEEWKKIAQETAANLSLLQKDFQQISAEKQTIVDTLQHIRRCDVSNTQQIQQQQKQQPNSENNQYLDWAKQIVNEFQQLKRNIGANHTNNNNNHHHNPQQHHHHHTSSSNIHNNTHSHNIYNIENDQEAAHSVSCCALNSTNSSRIHNNQLNQISSSITPIEYYDNRQQQQSRQPIQYFQKSQHQNPTKHLKSQQQQEQSHYQQYQLNRNHQSNTSNADMLVSVELITQQSEDIERLTKANENLNGALQEYRDELDSLKCEVQEKLRRDGVRDSAALAIATMEIALKEKDELVNRLRSEISEIEQPISQQQQQQHQYPERQYITASGDSSQAIFVELAKKRHADIISKHERAVHRLHNSAAAAVANSISHSNSNNVSGLYHPTNNSTVFDRSQEYYTRPENQYQLQQSRSNKSFSGSPVIAVNNSHSMSLLANRASKLKEKHATYATDESNIEEYGHQSEQEIDLEKRYHQLVGSKRIQSSAQQSATYGLDMNSTLFSQSVSSPMNANLKQYDVNQYLKKHERTGQSKPTAAATNSRNNQKDNHRRVTSTQATGAKGEYESKYYQKQVPPKSQQSQYLSNNSSSSRTAFGMVSGSGSIQNLSGVKQTRNTQSTTSLTALNNNNNNNHAGIGATTTTEKQKKKPKKLSMNIPHVDSSSSLMFINPQHIFEHHSDSQLGNPPMNFHAAAAASNQPEVNSLANNKSKVSSTQSQLLKIVNHPNLGIQQTHQFLESPRIPSVSGSQPEQNRSILSKSQQKPDIDRFSEVIDRIEGKLGKISEELTCDLGSRKHVIDIDYRHLLQ